MDFQEIPPLLFAFLRSRLAVSNVPGQKGKNQFALFYCFDGSDKNWFGWHLQIQYAMTITKLHGSKCFPSILLVCQGTGIICYKIRKSKTGRGLTVQFWWRPFHCHRSWTLPIGLWHPGTLWGHHPHHLGWEEEEGAWVPWVHGGPWLLHPLLPRRRGGGGVWD